MSFADIFLEDVSEGQGLLIDGLGRFLKATKVPLTREKVDYIGAEPFQRAFAAA